MPKAPKSQPLVADLTKARALALLSAKRFRFLHRPSDESWPAYRADPSTRRDKRLGAEVEGPRKRNAEALGKEHSNFEHFYWLARYQVKRGVLCGDLEQYSPG